MYPKLLRLLQTARAVFPVVSKTFKGTHHIILNPDGIPCIVIWYQAKEGEQVFAYQVTLDEFDWDNIDSEFAKMRSEIVQRHAQSR